MIEINVIGDWPETSIEDICNVRNKINEFNLDAPRVVLIGPNHLLNNLDAQYEEAALTYMSVLKENKLIDKDIRFRTNDKFAILYAYSLNAKNFPKINFETAQVKITNIRSVLNRNTQIVTCSECGHEGEIPLGDRDGDYYLWFKCGECRHETKIRSSARRVKT